MSMIAKAFKPDMEDYASGYDSEGEVYYGQYCATRPLIEGAAAILEKSQETCDSCCYAYDLLHAFREGMGACEEGIINTERNPPREVSADEIREKMGDEVNLMVCLYSTKRDPIKEWFIVKAKDPKAVEAA